MNRDKPFFTPIEIFLFFLALLFTALILRVIMIQSVAKAQVGLQIRMLVLGIWAILSFLQFMALRRKQVFIAWTIIALIQFSMFVVFYNNTYLNYLDKYDQQRNYSRFLITPVILLAFYQLCRQFSLFFYKQELGFVSVNLNILIVGEDRVANGIERICSGGMFVLPILIYYFCYYS